MSNQCKRNKTNFLNVQLKIIQQIEIEYNFLLELKSKSSDIENKNLFAKLKELVSRDLILNIGHLFDERDNKYSFNKLYCICFKKNINDVVKNNDKTIVNIQKRILESVIFFNKDFLTIRDKYVAHLDFTKNTIRLPFEKIKKLLKYSKEIHSLFSEYLDESFKDVKFHDKVFNELIDNQIKLEGIEKDKIDKIINK